MIHNRRACALITIGSLVTALTGLTTLAANAQPSGSIGADVTADVIHGSGFGSSATLTVQRGTTTESWTNGVSGPWDYNPDSDSFGLYLQGAWDVQPGDHVTVEGNGLVDAMTVTDVRVTGWQFADNVVSGTVAPSDNDFPIYLSVSHYSQQDPSTLVVQRNGVSGWSGDLDNVDTNESPPIHIRVNDSVEACQPDANANESCSDTVLAGPRFAFGVELQEVVGIGWPNGSPVSLTINRPGVRKAVFTATMTPPTADPYGGRTCPTWQLGPSQGRLPCRPPAAS